MLKTKTAEEIVMKLRKIEGKNRLNINCVLE